MHPGQFPYNIAKVGIIIMAYPTIYTDTNFIGICTAQNRPVIHESNLKPESGCRKGRSASGNSSSDYHKVITSCNFRVFRDPEILFSEISQFCSP